MRAVDNDERRSSVKNKDGPETGLESRFALGSMWIGSVRIIWDLGVDNNGYLTSKRIN
jgi:hypothetical protein